MADQKVWFITGVSRGFGEGLTEHALAHGDIVIGTTRDGKASFSGDTRNVHLLPLEMTDLAAIRATIAKAHALHGRLDVVVNNAGYGLLGSVEEATEEQVTHVFEVNFHGTRRVVQAVLPFLRRQRSGHILNITSIAGLAPGAGSGFYAASKFAVEGFTQSLAQAEGRCRHIPDRARAEAAIAPGTRLGRVTAHAGQAGAAFGRSAAVGDTDAGYRFSDGDLTSGAHRLEEPGVPVQATRPTGRQE